METAQTKDRARPLPALVNWLIDHRVEYSLHEHPTTWTARETARAEHVSPQAFAKAVGVMADNRPALVVLEASDHLDLLRARRVIGATAVRLMTEDELGDACPGCEIGATPAVGVIFALPTYADVSLREDPEITFAAGSHGWAVRVDRAAWERAAAPVYADVAEQRNVEPAWFRS
jgi:Ala-tRNA(Pro) deacylase